MKRVAVIGAGISGLAAAFHLAASGQVQLTVYEGSGRAGGVLETIRDEGYLVERSADNFATLIPDALQLSRECGLADTLIPPAAENRQAFVLHRGRVVPIPAGFSLMQPTRLGSILTTPALSWRGKLRLLGEYWIPPATGEADESLEAFAVRRLGREAFENLVEPIVSGIFTADPARLSMRATMPQFFDMERRSGGLIRGYLASRRQDAAAAARRASGARYDQFLAPREGMSSWIAQLQSHLPAGCLRLATPVEALRHVPSHQVATADATSAAAGPWRITAGGEQESFDAVICATPAAVTARLLESAAPDAAGLVAQIPYASSVVVAMVVARSEIARRTDGFGLIVPRKEGRASLAISYTSNKYPGRVPPDQLLLRIFFGGALQPQLVDLPDSALEQLAHQELREILGWRGAAAKWQAVIRWPQAMPQYLVGHVERMQALQQALAALPTLRLCGAGYAGVGIPQCVRGGRAAAQQILDDCQCSKA